MATDRFESQETQDDISVLNGRPEIKLVTVERTTDSSGNVVGSTSDIFGVPDANILGIYFHRENSKKDPYYTSNRNLHLSMYGSGGYAINFINNNVPVNTDLVKFTVTYILN
jgi:hypothetical protein